MPTVFKISYSNSANPQTLVKSWNFLQYNFLGFCPAIETVCQIHLSLDHIKSSLIITNPNLRSCQDNRVNIINRNCFCQTGNHSWSLTPMFTLSKTVCKFVNAKENSKWSLMPFETGPNRLVNFLSFLSYLEIWNMFKSFFINIKSIEKIFSFNFHLQSFHATQPMFRRQTVDVFTYK